MIQLLPVKVAKQTEGFPLVQTILEGVELRDNDILAVSSKFVAMSEGRIVKLSEVKVSKKARALAKKYEVSPELCELVLRESSAVIGGIEGFLLAVSNGMIAPNAGVDKSNIYPGFAILYPKKPFAAAEQIKKDIFAKTGKKIGVVLTDSRLMPSRIGTTGVAVAVAGFEPVQDCIGMKDLFGNELKVTKRAIADDIAAAAELLMGEADEAIPIVVARGVEVSFTERKITHKEMTMDWKKDFYVRGLRQRP